MQAAPIDQGERLVAWRCRVWQAIQMARRYPSLKTGSTDASGFAPLAWRLMAAWRQAEARLYFRAALHNDPYGVSAWVGLSRIADTGEERRLYLQAAFDVSYLIHTTQHHHLAIGED